METFKKVSQNNTLSIKTTLYILVLTNVKTYLVTFKVSSLLFKKVAKSTLFSTSKKVFKNSVRSF